VSAVSAVSGAAGTGLTDALQRLDWSARWLAPYRRLGLALSAELARGASVAEALNAALPTCGIALDASPLRFVPQAALPEGEAYETFIYRSACVPTRDNLHDLLGGLVWLQWPQLKRRLNTLHSEAVRQAGGVQAQRGPLRDALTLLDENGALLQAPPALCQALLERDWQRLFVELRPLWAQARLHLIGHALLEKLMQPRKGMCAHVLLLPDAVGERRADVDADAALLIQPEWLAGKPFLPLPVLGLPGWWAANEAADFYSDAQVFRGATRTTVGVESG
jgi:hypothetical protein